MKKYILAIFGLLPVLVLTTVKAQCPICTAAVIGGVGLARWLKIDDAITGLWVGGLIVSTIIWTINWCNRKKLNFWARDILIVIAYYTIIIIPLYYYNIIGHPLNKLWSVDKLMLGTVIGSIFFYAAYLQYEKYKKEHGKALFPFQRVVMPVGTLLALSLIFYFVTRR
jgi:hypothetical protein